MDYTIQLTKGKFARVDEEDFLFLSSRRWYAYQNTHAWYARNDAVGLMHREVARRAGLDILGLEVDHINGDGLDNRRKNLRAATKSQNRANQTRKVAGKTSKYKGVSWSRDRRKWRADIKVDGKRKNLGRFDTQEEARDAYNKAAQEAFGEFASQVKLP